MATQRTPHSGNPAGLRDWYTVSEILTDAGITRTTRVGEMRRLLRDLCEEQDTERERYRQKTIERAQEGGA